MSECVDKKCEDCSIETMVQEIKECNFECTGGLLENHRGYMALVARVEQLQAENEQYGWRPVAEVPEETGPLDMYNSKIDHVGFWRFRGFYGEWENIGETWTHWRYIVLPKEGE